MNLKWSVETEELHVCESVQPAIMVIILMGDGANLDSKQWLMLHHTHVLHGHLSLYVTYPVHLDSGGIIVVCMKVGHHLCVLGLVLTSSCVLSVLSVVLPFMPACITLCNIVKRQHSGCRRARKYRELFTNLPLLVRVFGEVQQSRSCRVQFPHGRQLAP